MSITFDGFVYFYGEETLPNDGNLEGFFALKGKPEEEILE